MAKTRVWVMAGNLHLECILQVQDIDFFQEVIFPMR